MEQQPANAPGIFELKIDDTGKSHLLTMASWALVIVIIAIIKYILSIVDFLRTRDQVSAYQEEFGVSLESGSSMAGMIITICIGLLINYFLYQFSTLTKRGINNLSQYDLNRGFGSLRTYFAIIGVLVIIALFFGGLAFLMSDARVSTN